MYFEFWNGASPGTRTGRTSCEIILGNKIKVKCLKKPNMITLLKRFHLLNRPIPIVPT